MRRHFLDEERGVQYSSPVPRSGMGEVARRASGVTEGALR
jgi:hypothetical protein